MTSEQETAQTHHKTNWKVTCHDHEGVYWHLRPGHPEKCQHCGSYNIEWEKDE